MGKGSLIFGGLDPGLRRTGYGVIEVSGAGTIRIVDAGIIATDPKADLGGRLRQLYDELSALLAEYPFACVGIEELYSHYAHPRTAILMGHARGVLLLAARRRNLHVESFSATRIKKFLTGSGHAGKAQIQRAVLAELRVKPGRKDIPPDVSDALAIALCCHEYTRTKRR